jgi:hypothetical protein
VARRYAQRAQRCPGTFHPGDERPTTNDDRPTTTDESATAQHSSSVIRPSSLKDRTLTSLYNQRPTWLNIAHTKLDRAVLDAYGWPHDIADEELLARLLALNLERAGLGDG